MTRSACVVLTLLALGALLRPVSAQAPPLQATLDSARSALGAPGAAAAVLCTDGTMWSAASGFARPGVPASPGTAFELGSVTKTYTAALVLRLVAEGGLRLDDPLALWHPDLPGAGEITVERLLNHSHGLHDPLQDEDFVPSILGEPSRVWTTDDVLARMREPHFAPGAGWRYSNTGYHLLGTIAEQVGDAPFSTLIRARVLGPSSLEESWYGGLDSVTAPMAAAFIDVNGDGSPLPVSLFMPWTAFLTSAGPAGAMISTAPDAARWLHALVSGAVLGEAEWRRMTTWVDRPDGHRYGLGLLRLEGENGALLGHKGNSAGFSASVFHDSATGMTASVLTNAHAVDATPSLLGLLRAAREADLCRG